MIQRLLTITTLISVLLLEGCATPTSMAFSKDAGSSSGKVKPVFLMTATLKNKYRTSHQPKLLVVNVEKDIVKGAADRINFTMDADAKNESDDPNIGSSYLLRMELEDGKYVLRGLSSMVHPFLFTAFSLPQSTRRSRQMALEYFILDTLMLRCAKETRMNLRPEPLSL